MDLRDALLEGLEYDAWATGRWLDAAEHLPFAERAHAVMAHMLRSQRFWAVRVRQHLGLPAEEPAATGDDLRASFAASLADWRGLLEAHNPATPITYDREGVAQHTTLGNIARHVINHGTYHRGHLRGLADAAGTDAFEDTDLSLFHRLRSEAGR